MSLDGFVRQEFVQRNNFVGKCFAVSQELGSDFNFFGVDSFYYEKPPLWVSSGYLPLSRCQRWAALWVEGHPVFLAVLQPYFDSSVPCINFQGYNYEVPVFRRGSWMFFLECAVDVLHRSGLVNLSEYDL